MDNHARLKASFRLFSPAVAIALTFLLSILVLQVAVSCSSEEPTGLVVEIQKRVLQEWRKGRPLRVNQKCFPIELIPFSFSSEPNLEQIDECIRRIEKRTGLSHKDSREAYFALRESTHRESSFLNEVAERDSQSTVDFEGEISFSNTWISSQEGPIIVLVGVYVVFFDGSDEFYLYMVTEGPDDFELDTVGGWVS